MFYLLTRLGNIPIAAIETFKRDTVIFSSRHIYFGLVAGFGFPLYYVVWGILYPQPYENLPLRLAGSAIFVPVIFAKLWPESIKRHFPVYWYMALLFALPFFFTFMLFKNDGSTVWLLSCLVGLFVMILLLDTINLLIQILLGVGCAILAYYLTADSTIKWSIDSLEYVPIFLFAIVMGIVVNYSGEKMRNERRQAMLATAGMVAHELRTPLLSVKSGALGLQQHLPVLMDAYLLAVQHKLVDESIRAIHLDSMSGVLDRIEAEADRSNTIIDMLLYSVREMGVTAKRLISCSMVRCIETALRRYPFTSDKDRGLVNWDARTDFLFMGDSTLMVHVIFNLLKNALRHIATAGKGQIWIKLETDELGSSLIFRDTGPGIPAEVLPHIFTRYYAWPTHTKGAIETTGVGLAFCREVMHAFGGSIECYSQLNEFTEFRIRFPRRLN